ncbi:hypothetical protein Micbo1qcDRAFT_179155 [Microdochium bolleyi]|uniref:Uncharacterized protein n=1 Tax=Microdochium bolleyi TaxID=196109 RepID=A0A136IQS9_9PEZI|nr:hypothetical protein Micbo1qcDRAFT_179155 [Microdochium bolleyi]
MYLPSTLTTISVLPVTALALDLRFFLHTRGCAGSSVACNNAPPNMCYSMNDQTNGAVVFENIPAPWTKCHVDATAVSPGVCFGGDHDQQPSGMCYRFINGRAKTGVAPAELGQAAPGEECVRVNQLVLADGAEYNLESVDTIYSEMLVKAVDVSTMALDSEFGTALMGRKRSVKQGLTADSAP